MPDVNYTCLLRIAPILVLLILLAAICHESHIQSRRVYFSSLAFANRHNHDVGIPGISLATFQEGLAQCERHVFSSSPAEQLRTRSDRTNPRGAINTTLLIKNGHIWLGNRYVDGDVLIRDGTIRKISSHLEEAGEGVKVIDAGGRVVTPGLIDMHSHMMSDSLGGIQAHIDGHEMTGPIKPYVRVLDALSPSDMAIKIVASGGVTTSLALPGSANLMGGEGAVVKLRPVPTLSGEDMLVAANVTDDNTDEVVWRYMKMACGDNAKNWYGRRGSMPQTRMGNAYLLRQQFQAAQELRRAQDDWCDAALRVKRIIDHGSPGLQEPFPYDPELESLIALLRHKVKLNVHCYLPHDIEALVRHSLEFNFDIAAIHHASSAWQVPDIIKRARNNVTIATHTDLFGTTAEVWDQNVYAPQILTKAGIPVTFITDHPVLSGQDLLYEAQKAAHYGLGEHESLAAVTSTAAAALGLGHRLGSIEPGKDADIVIWERHPLRLGARPKHVFVDGYELDFTASWFPREKKASIESQKARSTLSPSFSKDENNDRHSLPRASNPSMTLDGHDSADKACRADINTFVLRNISRIYSGPSKTYAGKSISLVVTEGLVTCIGADCVSQAPSIPTFNLQGGVIIPGIISTGGPIGMSEMINEPGTYDGYSVTNIRNPDLLKTVVRAADGLHFNGFHIRKAYKSGVTAIVSQPMTAPGELLAGVSVAFRAGIRNTMLDTNSTFIRREAALHFQIVHTGDMTVSQQIAMIRHLLQSNIDGNTTTNVFARASQGLIPVFVNTDDMDEIVLIARLKRDSLPLVKFVILGGAEAHLAVKYLVRFDIGVLFKPSRCISMTWQSRRCLYGPPMTPDTGLDVLLRNGVLVGIASDDEKDGSSRNLIWDAGWNLAHNPNLSTEMAVGLVTWNVARLFGLDGGSIQVGGEASFVAYNSNPFEFGTRVQMVYGGGRPGPSCFPKQY
ncbi:hypothetical protein BX666DRAFT_1984528 [Dichotomocladium elegans]|nr:hypothetical protein BX666DRAFT_1984528 [Dichotomocladium elegans]